MTFPEYLEKKFLEWQLKEGERKTTTQFAAYIGVSQPLLSMWLSGAKRPGRINIEILAEIFGQDVYDALGEQRPNPYQQRANQNWEYLPEERQKQIAEEAERYATQNQVQGAKKTHQRRKTRKAE